MTQKFKNDVKKFWEARPCGSSLTAFEPGSREFYDDVEATRYRLEPFIPSFAEFDRWRGRRVLEIGVGLGTDFTRFARAGADLSGIDLTETAIDLVGRRLDLEELSADIRVSDAESLPFADGSFDLVYSWGVLHHTPNTARALDEVRRVLAPGGEVRIMLYSRRSWVALGLWLRYALGAGRPWRSFAWVVSNHMESPGTKAYTRAELQQMFGAFADVDLEGFVTPYDRRVSGPLASVMGPRFGWFVGVRASR